MIVMAREGDNRPTEMPEKLFRQCGDFREIREIARKAEAAQASARADAAIEHAASAAGPAGASLYAVGSLTAGRRRVFVVLVASAIAAWVVAIVAGLKLGGMI